MATLRFFRQRPAIALLLCLVAGCAADPLAGLHTASGAAAPLNARLPRIEGKSAIVPSRNLDSFLEDSGGTDARPQYLITGATAVLRSQHPDLVLLDNLAVARARGIERTFVLDAQRGGQGVTVTIVVLDRSQRPVSRIEATGTDSEGSARRSYDRALEALRRRMREVSA